MLNIEIVFSYISDKNKSTNYTFFNIKIRQNFAIWIIGIEN